MTPAIKILQQKKIQFKIREYSCDEESQNSGNNSGNNYGMQAVLALGQDPKRVFKTLLAVNDGNDRKPVVAIIPVADLLDLKKIASHYNSRKTQMADPMVAQRVTGYVIGGISPIGQKQLLKSCIDQSAFNFATIFVSAGKRGLQLELNPADLESVINATVAELIK